MDHRVKPGGDDREGTCRLLVIASAAEQSSGLAREAGLLRRFAPRNDGYFIRPGAVKRSGGGGPPEGRWRGRAALRLVLRPPPLPPLCCAERSPFPASRGRTNLHKRLDAGLGAAENQRVNVV